MARRRKTSRRTGLLASVLLVALFAIGAVAAPHLEDNLEHQLNATVQLTTDGALGSGVLVQADGLILTNAHCAGPDTKVVDITLRDGRTYKGIVLLRDEAADVMVVAIRERDLAAVPLRCNVVVHQGDAVLAIGHPGGMLWTVTRGIVSALDRGPDKRWLQVDALIWFGNSGGPLFDIRGRLIGLNNALYRGHGQATGHGLTLNLRHICRALRAGGIKFS